MLNKINRTYNFIGKHVAILLVIDFFVGVFWFAIESGFLVVFQGFLLSINLLSIDTIKLPVWYPKDLYSNLLIISFYGLIRAVLTGAKKVVPAMAAQVFAGDQRIKILASSFFLVDRRSTSEIVGAFGELANKASQYVLHGSHMLSSLAVTVLLLLLSLRLAPLETICSMFLLVVVMLPLRGFNKRIRKNGEGVVREWDSVNKVLVEGIKNIFLLRLYNLTSTEYSNGVGRLKAYESHRTRYQLISAVITSAPLFLGLIIIAFVTFFSRKYFSTDPYHFVAFLYLFMRLAQNLSQLNSSWSSMSFYKESFIKLYSWTPVSAGHETVSSSVNSSEFISPVEIQMRDVSFGYNPSLEILNNFNVTVRPGGFLLLKGPSGVGKSTLIKLLTSMEVPSKGEILIDGKSPSHFLKFNSESIGYVGPEPFLVPGTVRENLLYGKRTNVTDDEIRESLTAMGMQEVINAFPGKLDEKLHEETQLSTGQKQRLSFARAILRRPSLLILDEATANIDFKTELFIINFLKSISGKVTIVAVSHRDSFNDIASISITMDPNQQTLTSDVSTQ
jgi:ABC-type multidrug transport system fused ATPase/permease subunit